MAKKKVYKQGATHEEIEAQFAHFDLFGEGGALDAIPDADKARPSKPPKLARLDWDPVEKIDTDAAWDAFLSNV